MKNVIRRILNEMSLGSSESGFSGEESSVLKLLTNRGFTPKTRRGTIINFLVDDLGYEPKEAMDMYLTFLHNYTSSGDYESVKSPRKVKFDFSTKKVPTANYTARDLVQGRIPFKGSNTTGEYIGNVYVVTSYGWYPIFVYKDGKWYENSNRYSRSTGKQMGQLRPKPDTIKLTKDELNDLIYI